MQSFLEIFGEICDTTLSLVLERENKRVTIGNLCGRVVNEIRDNNAEFVEKMVKAIEDIFSIKPTVLTFEIHDKIFFMASQLFFMRHHEVLKTASLFQQFASFCSLSNTPTITAAVKQFMQQNQATHLNGEIDTLNEFDTEDDTELRNHPGNIKRALSHSPDLVKKQRLH